MSLRHRSRVTLLVIGAFLALASSLAGAEVKPSQPRFT